MDTRKLGVRGPAIVVGLGLGIWGQIASAHIELLSPPARYGPNLQKDDPCGDPLNPPGEGAPTVLLAGQGFIVEFDEFVDHPGYFRVAIDPTGTDAFTSPTDFGDVYNSPEVILDDILDTQDGGLHQVEITVPDVPCNPCTLQLIQVMTEDGVFGPGNDDLYFQCADIVIEPPGLATADAETTSEGDSTGDGPAPAPGEATAFAGTETNTGTTGAGSGGSREPDGGCGCRSRRGAGGAAPWLLLVLGARPRRRRPTVRL